MNPAIRVRFFRPRESLRPFVDCHWSWETDGRQSLPRLLPEPAPELLLYYGEPFRCTSAFRDYGQVPRIHLVGFRDRYYDILSPGPVGFLAVRFKPGGLSNFLGRRPSEWTNDFAPARDLWSEEGHALEESFLAARGLQERVRIVEEFLESRLLRHYRHEPQWQRILAGIDAALDRQESRVDGIARTAGTTVRSLQREFHTRLGLSPKTYLRLRRFESLLIRCQSKPESGYLSAGQDLGYYDQSHIIRDFAVFAGRTPSHFLRDTGYLSLFYNTGPPDQGRIASARP